MGSFEAETHEKELRQWKSIAEQKHQEYLSRVQQEEERRRKEELEEFEKRVSYVHERVRGIERREMRRKRHAEQAEVDRIEKRKQDREDRARLRIAGYEANERTLMGREDTRSWWMRYDENDRMIQARERENMFNEELEQTAIDSFWGFATAARLAQEALERKQAAYDALVEQMRIKCIQAHIVKPTKWEAKHKVFKDVFTGKPIT